ETAAQVTGGPAKAVNVDRLALRHPGFHLLQLAGQRGCTAHKAQLGLAEHVPAAQIADVAHYKIAVAPRPRRIRVAPDEQLPPARDRAPGPLLFGRRAHG